MAQTKSDQSPATDLQEFYTDEDKKIEVALDKRRELAKKQQRLSDSKYKAVSEWSHINSKKDLDAVREKVLAKYESGKVLI